MSPPDRSVLVTGAGRGLGAAYARHLAARGWAVVVNDVEEEAASAVAERIRDDGGTAVAHAADVGDWDDAAALVTTAVDAFGRLDGVVNNAGVFHLAEAQEETEARLRRIVAVNLLGTMFVGTHAIAWMRDHGGGAIVNVVSGAQSGMAHLGAYGATKGGIASLTYAWAVEQADHGIRVNAVSPNAHTRMADAFAARFGEQAVRSNLQLRPEGNAPTVAWLLSEQAGVTGQVLRVDGTDLSVTSHPRRLPPVAHGAAASEASVAAAVSGQLRPNLQDVGLGRVD